MNPETPSDKTRTIRNTPLLVVMYSLIFIVAAAVVFVLTKPQLFQNPRTNKRPAAVPTSTDGIYQKNVKFPPAPPEEREVYSYTGQILLISDTTFKIRTGWGDKVVTTSASTIFTRQVRPTREEREQLSIDEVAARLAKEYPVIRPAQVGDDVIVSSKNNIRGTESFIADKIIIIEQL